MNDPLPDNIDELIALAAMKVERTPDSELFGEDFRQYFNQWREENNISPGVVPCLIASDAYRHMLQWMDRKGYELPPTQLWAFGREMRRVGFAKGRYQKQGRDTRPYLMDVNTAAHLRVWLKANPTPPLNEGAFQPVVNTNRRKKEQLDGT